jgi:hypothetical protein
MSASCKDVIQAGGESAVADAASAFTTIGADDLPALASVDVPWLWHGYLARGNVTLLTSQWKSGKTTLLSVLLSKMGSGGSLAGLAVSRGKAVVLSEEGALHWHRRSLKAPFGPHVRWLCRTFRGKPRREDWLALIGFLDDLRARDGFDLLVIDPLASFLPGRTENGAGGMMDTLLPLQKLTAEGVAVLVLHHPRKGETIAGQAARGSGALSGYVDFILEMSWHGEPGNADRRRRLVAYSRYEETPANLVIELAAEGGDYAGLGDSEREDFQDNWKELRLVLEFANDKLTAKGILNEWPTDCRPPDPATLWRWLRRAVGDGIILQNGTGRRNDPYKYWLPASEERWKNDPFRIDFPELDPLPLMEPIFVPRRREKG